MSLRVKVQAPPWVAADEMTIFAGGEAVVIDCQGETVLIDDADAREDGEPREPGFLGERVSLRLRAWPLIQMLEKAHAADKPIVWGV